MYSEYIDFLVSPLDGSKLIKRDNAFYDINNNKFKIINNVPILLDEEKSLFRVDASDNKNKFTSKSIKSDFVSFLTKLKPSINLSLHSKENYNRLCIDLSKKKKAFVLIIGAGERDGNGLDTNLFYENIKFIKTDVFLSKNIDVVCDAHSLPFKENIFDAVIIQAVLEHVTDPYLCVNEIYRVLKHEGFVYSETPFMQQVHLGRYDFTRFTHLGHRRLFNNFEEIKSGVICGPAVALTWSIKYFIRSFFKPSFLQFFAEWFFTFFYFWIKYLDYFLVSKIGSYDAASGYYFYGKKSKNKMSDNDLINQYKGMIK